MAQSHDKDYPPDLKPSGAWGGFAAKIRTNQSALNTWHAGTSAPANPETNQRWLDTSVTPALLKIYSGAAWVLLETYVAIFKEIADARGSAASVNARLAVSLAADGSLIPATTLSPDEFKTVAGTYTRTGASTFTVTGDLTAVFHAKRRVKMVGDTTTYSHVVSSVFGAVTTVTIADTNVPTTMTANATGVGLVSASAAVTGLLASGLASASGGYVEDYLEEIVTARGSAANLNARLLYDRATLTNSAAGSTAVGDVLAVSSQTAILGDTVSSLQKFVVAQAIIANAASGEFARSGVVSAKSQGTIAAMQYVRKSATARAIEDAGVAVGATASPPQGAAGFAMAAASGGFCTIFLFDTPAAAPFYQAGADDTERTTVSTSFATLSTFSGLSIPNTATIRVVGRWRKTLGAFAADVALSLNGVSQEFTINIATIASSANQAEVGSFEFIVPPRTSTTYQNGGALRISSNAGAAAFCGVSGHSSGDLPTATVTDIIVQGKVGNAAITVAVQNVRVYVEG